MRFSRLVVAFGLFSLTLWLQGCGGGDEDDGDGNAKVTTTEDDHDHDHDHGDETTDHHHHDDHGDETTMAPTTAAPITTTEDEHDHDHEMCAPKLKEPPIPGVMPGMEKPKIILGQDIDWPGYAFMGSPPESDFETEGIGKDIAKGLESVCDIEVHVTEVRWSDCWGNAVIGDGLSAGELHGCMTYTHTFGARNRFCEFSAPILKDNKPGGILVRLDEFGDPEISGDSDLSGKKVVDVVGWAPTADTLALAENKCTKQRFSGYTIVQPTMDTGNANNDALKTLLDGDADAMWVYADQVKNYQCGPGATPNWDCEMWAGFGTNFSYIQTGLFGHAQAGTTLALSKKGSGLKEILDPCIEKFLETKDYYDICVKHGFVESCFKNDFFPSSGSSETLTWELPTDQLTTKCEDGYCPCPAETSDS
mmetsp:Transcript_7069/g.11524  ORF Transcript_7069/g.11524 Transcript_7069/m.11524 type:complete len:421 (+) Transcript_7069:58-1320(+)